MLLVKEAEYQEGFVANVGNYHDQSKKWLKSVYDEDVKFEKTNFVHQTAIGGKEDYEKWKKIDSKKYDEPIVTVLVKNGKTLNPVGRKKKVRR